MPEYENEMRAVMKALNQAGALPHCIVTGSWACQTQAFIWIIHERAQ